MWAATLLLMAAPASSLAATRSVAVAVVALEPAQESRALATAIEVSNILRGDPRFTLVDVYQRSWSRRAPQAAEGKAALTEARNAFDELQVPLATTKVNEAITVLEQSDLTSNFRLLLDALAFRTLVLQVRGEGAEATGKLEQLFALDPAYAFEPDQKRINPKFAELAARVRAELGAKPKTSLHVQSPEAAGLVYVDGVFQGVSPVQAKGLLPGTHYVTMLAPGYDAAQASASTSDAQPFQAHLARSSDGDAFRARMDAVKASFTQGSSAEGGTEFARWAGADQALVAVLASQDNGVRLSALAILAGGEVKARMAQAFAANADVSELARAIVRLLDENAIPKLNSPPVLAPSWDRQRLANLALGTSAVAGLSSVVLGVVSYRYFDYSEQYPRISLQESNSAYEKSKWAAIGAGGLLVLSVASGVAGFVWRSGPSTPSSPKQLASPKQLKLWTAPLHDGGGVFILGDFE